MTATIVPFDSCLLENPSANTLTTSVLLTAEQDGIESGLIFRVRYRAVNQISEGPWSDTAYIRAATLPRAPPSPVASDFDATTIVLQLSSTSHDGDSAGGAAFRYYFLTTRAKINKIFILLLSTTNQRSPTPWKEDI